MTSKRKTGGVRSVFLIHLVLVSTLLIGSSRVHAADIVNQQLFDRYSVTYFEFPSSSACTRIFASISGYFTVSKQSGDSAQGGSTVQAAYIVYDNCSGIYQILANGSAQFPGSSGVHIEPSLRRARIDASFVITDYQTQALIPVVISAVNTGVGDTLREKIMSHDVGRDYVFNGRYIGNFRSAKPSGTITFGTTTYDLSQASYTENYFGTLNYGFISIIHR
jgi:hypothetical protein